MDLALFQTRLQEVKDFFEAFNKYEHDYTYTDAILLKMLPFRNTQDIDFELDMMRTAFYNPNIQSYYDLVGVIYRNVNPNYDFSKFYYWLQKLGIDISSFKQNVPSSWLLGRNEKYLPANLNKAYSRAKSVYAQYSHPSRGLYIGNYAEFIAYNDLLRRGQTSIDWVSRSVGDGLGYDMVTQKDSITHYYEVKAVASGNVNVNLTPNETRVYMNMVRSRFPENYHVMIVPMVFDGQSISSDVIDIPAGSDKNVMSSNNVRYAIIGDKIENNIRQLVLIK